MILIGSYHQNIYKNIGLSQSETPFYKNISIFIILSQSKNVIYKAILYITYQVHADMYKQYWMYVFLANIKKTFFTNNSNNNHDDDDHPSSNFEPQKLGENHKRSF